MARSQCDGVVVSTVFLGLDHSFEGAKPVLFETMVSGGTFDGEQDRYHTWADAERGHVRMCAKVWSLSGVLVVWNDEAAD